MGILMEVIITVVHKTVGSSIMGHVISCGNICCIIHSGLVNSNCVILIAMDRGQEQVPSWEWERIQNWDGERVRNWDREQVRNWDRDREHGTGVGNGHGARIGSGSTVAAGKEHSVEPGRDTTGMLVKALNGDILLKAQTLRPKDFVGDRVGDDGGRITRSTRNGTRVGTHTSRSTGANTSDPGGRAWCR
jgi:hypothetical protein